jgi:hypothetical protein
LRWTEERPLGADEARNDRGESIVERRLIALLVKRNRRPARDDRKRAVLREVKDIG